ncbi:hypothetical protein CIB95_14230 [Lottiidibacillus patelloidae]|uniref:Uncharacterized protein n=1 Tax=Lottiidibacillus patelloidae TaxID=2670334 RepID=A0A263BQL0_9BACI|nr:helix-turn-helix domain-containing protein [Lottiidibacillus patelloidae]OZM55999.1 hypothetical protein CIB95_14230 [Lottiidibacillus patelloidae]
MDDIKLNVALLKRKVPNITSAAKAVGLRPATVSNLTTGKIPIERAEVKTLVALAELADCSLDELIIRGQGGEIIETGIKLIDVFAPIVKGGTVGFVARPAMGQLVVLGEIFHRMRQDKFVTVWVKPKEASLGVEDVENEAEYVCKSLDEAYDYIKNIGKKKEVLLGADRTTVLTGEIYSFQEKLQASNLQPITTFLVDPRGDAVDEEEPYGPLDTLLQFDAELVSRRIYPAINPVLSTSIALEGAHVDKIHMDTQQKAKKLLRRYRELRFLINAFGMEKLSEQDKKTFYRGVRLEAYLTQPFFIAEPITNQKGEVTPLQSALQDLNNIMNGNLDNADPNELLYIGQLK